VALIFNVSAISVLNQAVFQEYFVPYMYHVTYGKSLLIFWIVQNFAGTTFSAPCIVFANRTADRFFWICGMDFLRRYSCNRNPSTVYYAKCTTAVQGKYILETVPT